MTGFTSVKRTTAQSIPDSTWTTVTWSSIIEDALAAWSSGTPTTITVPTGITRVEALVYSAWAPNGDAAKLRGARLLKNGSVIDADAEMRGDATATSGVNFLLAGQTKFRRLTVAAGDALTIQVLQNVGAALDFFHSTVGYTPYAQFKWIP